MPTVINTIIDENIQQRLSNKHEELIRKKKLDFIVIYIAKAEEKFTQCQKIFDTEWTKMLENHDKLVKNKEMPKALRNLIEQRLTNITDKLRDQYSLQNQLLFSKFIWRF